MELLIIVFSGTMFYVVLGAMKVAQTFESVDEMLNWDHLNERY